MHYSRSNEKSPIILHPVEELPWPKIRMDFCTEIKDYLVTMHCHTKFAIVTEITLKTTSAVMKTVKQIFIHHALVQKIMSDNGPPFNAREFTYFTNLLQMKTVTSNTIYAQSNGQWNARLE